MDDRMKSIVENAGQSIPSYEEHDLIYQIIDERRIMAKFDEILARLEKIEKALTSPK